MASWNLAGRSEERDVNHFLPLSRLTARELTVDLEVISQPVCNRGRSEICRSEGPE